MAGNRDSSGARQRRRQRQLNRSRFTLGGLAAELDPLLYSSFYETAQFDILKDPRDTRCYLIGRTGSGKTALLMQLKRAKRNNVIEIRPENLSLGYIVNSSAVRTLRDHNVPLAPLFVALWKHIIIVEIIRHRYSIKDRTARQFFMDDLMDRIAQDTSKVAALEYFRDFQDSFWHPTDLRVRELTDTIDRGVNAETELGVEGFKGTLGGEASRSSEERSELTARYQDYVNRTQLPRLHQMISVLDDDILDDPARFTWIVIDDLDKDWVDDELANELIRCLFQAVLDFNKVRNLKIIVALRENLFQELDFSGRHAAQEEKYRAQTMHIRWSKTDLIGMLDERVLSGAEDAGIADLDTVSAMLPNRNENARRKSAVDFILHRTMKRPRDAISFLTRCLEQGDGTPHVTWEHIEAAEFAYSEDRLLALRDEWKVSYPHIDLVFQQFSCAPTIMHPPVFLKLLHNVADLLALVEFDNSWLMEMLRPAWDGQDVGLSDFLPLIALLYRLGFIGVRLVSNQPIFEQDQPEFFRRGDPLATVRSFVVHPMFWAVLGIDRREDLSTP